MTSQTHDFDGDLADLAEDTKPPLLAVAVYDVHLVEGGPEEGGWYYQAGSLATEPDLVAMGQLFAAEDNDGARAARDRVQAVLDAEWNLGDRARDLSSVLSAGRYEAQICDGWPRPFYPEERPRYS